MYDDGEEDTPTHHNPPDGKRHMREKTWDECAELYNGPYWDLINESENFLLWHNRYLRLMRLSDKRNCEIIAEGIFDDEFFGLSTELEKILDEAEAEGLFDDDKTIVDGWTTEACLQAEEDAEKEEEEDAEEEEEEDAEEDAEED